MAARPPAPRKRTFSLPDGEMAALDFGSARRPVDIVFVHANGFNARTYRSILQPLAGEFRILAPDLRGHGRTRLPARARGRRDWRDMARDLVQLLEALDGPPATLAGHSMGGTVALLAAGKAPARVRNLVLYDPVIWGPVGVLMAHLPFARAGARRAPIAAQAARRRSVFDSKAAAFQAYRDRGAFKGWPDTMLRDYIGDGFIEREDGKVELACPPEWELSSYISHAHDPYGALRRFGGPVRIIRAARGSPTRVKDREAFARRYPGATVEKVDGGHFFPMTDPAVVKESLRLAAGG
ncbi:MAG: alpha/beta hydrolase [Caulobacteraceae bacterium]|nr:alpha/beta hydrolase [Caulobacteraceae bacterium]